ncbi:hypothetical protein E3P99_01169 [Wallemia hederae]|uniref:CobW C-terminal domain-containing protein n=1 Tax=Wallemia hederae TaxID=1540922 RepID=A0A4T0FSJ5_9BASI|nr:hypothetical protein E3P99_01169 [Wallemia hederae]
MSSIDKRIPITILSGFQGYGKSQAIANILKTKQDSLRTVVLTQSVDKVKSLANANAVKLADEDCVQLKDGCVCCSLRSELIGQIYDIANSGQYDYIIIEASDASDPEELASTMAVEMEDDEEDDDEAEEEDPDADEHERAANEKVKQILKEGGLVKFVKVDSVVSIVNGEKLLDDFHSTEFVGDGEATGDDDEDEEEESTLTDALISHLEFADVVYLNNATKLSADAKQHAHGVVKSLNHRAQVVDVDDAAVQAKDVINAGLFSPEQTFNPQWLKSVKNANGGDSYVNNNGIESFVYRRKVPFHPARLAKIFKDNFHFIQQSDAQDDEWEDQEETEEEDVQDKGKGKAAAVEEKEESAPLDEITTENIVDAVSRKQKGIFAPLLRAKGSFWMASRVAVGGAIQVSGPVLSAASGEMWYSKIPEEDIAQVSPEEQKYIRDVVFDDKFGDRRQEIFVVGGPNFNRKEFEQTLDNALLTDDEFNTYKSIFDKQMGVFDKDEELSKAFDGDSEFVQWADDLIMAMMDAEDSDEE